MSKYKKGDRVKVVRCEYSAYERCIGCTGTIISWISGEYPYEIEFDDSMLPNSCWKDEELELESAINLTLLPVVNESSLNSKPSNPKDAIGTHKVPMSVLPAQVIMEVALGMQEGALKYGRANYRDAGIRASIYYDATMRHLMAWWEGQDIDEDSGLSHVTKAIASLCVLRDGMLNEMWQDDRSIKVKNTEFIKDYNELSKEIIKKYPNPIMPFTEVNKKC